MVTLAVSSVVITLAYYTYNTLNLYFFMIEERNDTFAERLNLRYFFNEDIERADSVLSGEGELLFYTDTELVKWYSTDNDSSITRLAEADVKTFRTGLHFWQFYQDEELPFIKQVVISFWDKGDTAYFLHQKDYPARVYVNSKANGR